MLKLLEFINQNPWNWEQKLSEKPYCLTIKRKNEFISFNYNQIDSDFYNPIVRECRGLILDTGFNPVCVPFFKFGNYGEGYADGIDWSTARVQSKIDGSLIKVWYDYENEGWRISTNATIDAFDAPLGSDICEYKNFGELFLNTAAYQGVRFSNLNKDFTYMFELVSPWNKVVVYHPKAKIYHIGTRNNKTLEEIDIDIGVEKPTEYPLKSLEECIEAAKNLPFNEEGYVVVDANWNRVKIKSPAYVAAHHLRNNGVITKSRIIALLRTGEEDEFLNYYPEFKEIIIEIKDEIKTFCDDMNWALKKALNRKFEDRKRFAEFALSTKCSHIFFNWLYGKIKKPDEWLWKQPDDKIVEWIERI